MSEPTDAPTLYRVVYNDGVRDALRQFSAAARQAGNIEEAAAVVKDLDYRLHVYPQFGEPIMDLTLERGRIYLGAVPPLTVRYAVYEERRLVIVTVLQAATSRKE